jgi:hypothetical protein
MCLAIREGPMATFKVSTDSIDTLASDIVHDAAELEKVKGREFVSGLTKIITALNNICYLQSNLFPSDLRDQIRRSATTLWRYSRELEQGVSELSAMRLEVLSGTQTLKNIIMFLKHKRTR